jgi:hypothetical protein
VIDITVKRVEKMKNFFTKSIDEIEEKDISELIDTPEGQLFEIKKDLSAEKNKVDPWYNENENEKSRKGPGDCAKQSIFKELVAFANSEGGWLVLGLKETNDHPKRVAGISAIPDCHELVSRFERSAQDWIDPPLPSLTCRGIQIGNTQSEGVIVFRVPPSSVAPHRLYKKGQPQEAYKRIGDESKPMKMREIRDLVLETYRGYERLDREFEISKKRYLQITPEKSPKLEMVGFRITLVPLSPLTIDRPYLHNTLFDRRTQFRGSFSNGLSPKLETMDSLLTKRTASSILPILRGATCRWVCRIDRIGEPLDEDIAIIDVMFNGTINMIIKSTITNPGGLSIRWVLSDLANALIVAEKARIIGGNPNSEYALQIELRNDQYQEHSGTKTKLDSFSFGLLPEEDFHFSKQLGPDPVLLPRYRVGSKNEFPLLIKTIMDDLYNSVGKPHLDDFKIDPIE